MRRQSPLSRHADWPRGRPLKPRPAIAISRMMMKDPRSEWMGQLKEKRRELLMAYANEQFERGDEIKKVIEQIESHAASRGWREDKKA